MNSNRLRLEEFDSPVGRILLVTKGAAVRALDFGGYEDRLHRLLTRHWGPGVELDPRPTTPSQARRAIERYFEGDLAPLDSLEVETAGTDFQSQVWRALRTIPRGVTWSYGQLAERIGRPRAVRAVGLANSQNPVAIIVPCHRVVGGNTSLTGYAGGLERKAWLLRHEGAARCTVHSSSPIGHNPRP
jgi:methylated-DNA-[protein]-cysteine S-methyltransferase